MKDIKVIVNTGLSFYLEHILMYLIFLDKPVKEYNPIKCRAINQFMMHFGKKSFLCLFADSNNNKQTNNNNITCDTPN